MKTNYFYEAAKDCGMTLKEYLGQTEYNYVIVEGDKVVLWKDNDCPVIFGDYEDALAELGYWAAPVRNVSIITEKEMLETYCKNDYEMALAVIKAENEGGVMESHAHNEELVRKINDAWDKNKEGFYIILCALYKRDIEEITDSDAFRLPQWENTAEYVKGQRTGVWSWSGISSPRTTLSISLTMPTLSASSTSSTIRIFQSTSNMKSVKINGREVPVKDVVEVKMVMVSDTINYEVTYEVLEPMYQRLHVLLPQDKGYKLEKAVRRAMNK